MNRCERNGENIAYFVTDVNFVSIIKGVQIGVKAEKERDIKTVCRIL